MITACAGLALKHPGCAQTGDILGAVAHCRQDLVGIGAELGRGMAQSARRLGELDREAELKGVAKEFTSDELARWSTETETPWGRLGHLKPVVELSETTPYWARPSVPLGHHDPVWPARA